jgi:hypothetical protein
VASSQKKFDLAAAGKSRWIILSTFKKEVDFSQRLGKTSGFLTLSSNWIGIRNGKEKNFFSWAFSSR